MIRFFPLFALLALAGMLCARPCAASPHPFLPSFSIADPPPVSPPLITCPPNDTIDLAAGVCSVVYTYTITVSDPNALWAQTAGLPSGSTFYPGVTTNSFIAIDPMGNTGACSFVVAVRPAYGQLVCEDAVTVYLDSACAHVVTTAEVLDTITNGCPANLIVEVDRVPPYTGNGPWTPPVMAVADLDKTYQFRVTDPFTGNRCWGNVTIADTTRPAVSCPTIVVPCSLPQNLLTPDFLADSLGLATARPSAMDNCGGMLTITYADVPFNTACDPGHDIGAVIQRQWVVRDPSNNSAVCNQTVERRRLLSEVQFPANSTTACAAPSYSINDHGTPYYEVNGRRIEFIGLPLCDMDVNFYDTLETACGGTQRLRRTWKLFDLCQPPSATNPRTGVQWIDEIDTVGPVLNCPPRWTEVRSTPSCSLIVDLPDVTLSDACSSPVSVTAFWTLGGLTQSLSGQVVDSAGAHYAVLDSVTLPVGETVLYYSATDDCGSTGTCAITVAVYDSVPPAAVCDTLITVLFGADGTAALPAQALDNGSSDACGALSFRARRLVVSSCQPDSAFVDTLQLCCYDLDTIAVELRVYDVPLPGAAVPADFGAGQYTTCAVHIALLDTLAPRCVAPADLSISCRDFDPQLLGNDLFGWQWSCATDSSSLVVDLTAFDTTCRTGSLVRTLHVFGPTGTGSCTQQVASTPFQDYYVKFPNDVLVTFCDSTGLYGTPQIGNATCEDFDIAYTDQLFTNVPDACFKIERTWRIINRCGYDSLQPLTYVPNPTPHPNVNNPANFAGPIIAPANTAAPWSPSIIRINATDPQPTNYTQFWSATSNGYEYKQIIKVIDFVKPEVTGPVGPQTYGDITTNDPLLWNDLAWWDAVTLSHNLADGPAPLSIEADDDCLATNLTVSYELFLDLNTDGVFETVIDSDNPATTTPGFVRFGNVTTPSYTGGTPRQFDFRPVPTNQYHRFGLQTLEVNGRLQAHVRWFTQNPPANSTSLQGEAPQLPYGTHKIKWLVNDQCGNTTVYEHHFQVLDGKPPSVVCISGLSGNLLPQQSVTLLVNDFFTYGEDNYTPPVNLVYGIRRSGTGTGFPLDNQSNPITAVTFGCDDLGTQPVDVWVRDQQGLADSCATYALVQDNLQVCDTAFAGQSIVFTENGQGIPEVEIQLGGFQPGQPPYPGPPILTDSLGRYLLPAALPGVGSLILTPHKTVNPLNGVSTVDLLLISRHVLGLDTLPSPYKIIAADANASGSVTSFDIVEFRKLILGIYSALPNNESWRFVPANYDFLNPLFPFNPPFPESGSGLLLDFIGIKVGDVNDSADPQQLQSADDRSAPALTFVVDAQSDRVRTGEVVDVALRAAQPATGFQFTLQTDGLEILDVLPGTGLSAENFALFPSRRDVLTASWFTPVPAGEPATFTVRVRAWRDGTLADMLGMSDAITRAEAYTADGGTGGIQLASRASPDPSQGGGTASQGEEMLELYQNTPNPFAGATAIAFNLPGASPVVFTVFNAAGKLVYRQTGDFPSGLQVITIENNMLDHSGLYFYKIETAFGSASRKMEKWRE